METSLVKFDDKWMHVRHSNILKSRRTILFLHGLGDSSLAFLEAFQAPSLQNFNILAPDLLGYGGSSSDLNEDYSFRSQIQWLNRIIDELNISEFYLAGHSMGADIATYFTEYEKDKIRGLINIEGNLSPSDVVISKQAVEADKRGEFNIWFKNEFMNRIVLKNWGEKWESCRRYYASLWFCRPQAFLSNAYEVWTRNLAVGNTLDTEIGLIFQQIDIPKVYCWAGTLSEPTEKLINNKSIQNWGFKDAFHWLMIDKEKEFYSLLSKFCLEN